MNLLLNHLMFKICPDWSFCSNHTADPDGRISIIWRNPVLLSVIHQTSQSMTCILTLPNKHPLYYTEIYASNLSSDRSDLWATMLSLHSTLDLDDKAWIVGGDFNQIIFPIEHLTMRSCLPESLMYHLQDCFLQLGEFDMRYIGP